MDMHYWGRYESALPEDFSIELRFAGVISAILQRYTRDCLVKDKEESFAPYCSVVDVGSRRFYEGVRATLNRMRDVEAECRNIVAIWNSIDSDEWSGTPVTIQTETLPIFGDACRRSALAIW